MDSQKIESAEEDAESSERYGTLFAWSNLLGISSAEIKKRLKDVVGITAKDKAGRLIVDAFYSESTVREKCVELLTSPQADESGLVVISEDGADVHYRSAKGWAKKFNISEGIYRRLDGAPTRLCRASGGQLHEFYSEKVIKEKCSDFFEGVPVADKKGFLTHEWNGKTERFGNLYSWSKELNLSSSTARRKLLNLPSIRGKDNQGQIRDFIPESAITELFGKGDSEILTANEDGFVYSQNGEFAQERFALITTWAENLRVSSNAVRRRIGDIKGITAKTSAGRRMDQAYYSETLIRERCSDLLNPLPIADDNGFFIKDSTTYGYVKAWARKIGTSAAKIYARLKEQKGITARTCIGTPIENGFYSESVIREYCKDLYIDE